MLRSPNGSRRDPVCKARRLAHERSACPNPGMQRLLAAILPVLVSLGAITADNGDAMHIREIDQPDLNGPYNRIWEPHLAKWTDRQLISCYGPAVWDNSNDPDRKRRSIRFGRLKVK